MAPNNNTIENKTKSKKSFKEDDIPTSLSLNGSQINLANREQPSTSRDINSHRSLFLPSTCTFLKQRPMSAVPELHTYKAKDENSHRYKINSLRPQSADNISSSKQSKGNLALFECETSKLHSSKLLNKLVKEPVMRSWQNVIGSEETSRTSETDSIIYEDIQNSEETKSSGEENDEEEECIHSEISFGTKIQNLAQKNSPMNLEPGIKHKPPLPTKVVKLNSPKKSTDDVQKLATPPGVSMSKEYQEKYHQSSPSDWDNYNATCLSTRREIGESSGVRNNEIYFAHNHKTQEKDLCNTIPSVESKIDMYFRLSGNDTKIKEIEIFEQETDYLFKKLRSHQKAFTEYYEISKKLPEIIENEVVGSKTPSPKRSPNPSDTEPELHNTDFKSFELSNVAMEEIKDLIKRDFVEHVKRDMPPEHQVSDKEGSNTDNEKQFSLDKFDKGLEKDKEFLSSRMKADGDTKLDTDKEQISDLEDNANPLTELSVMPEREFANKKKRVESVQNVLSTLPTTYNDISTILHFLENDTNKLENTHLEDLNKWLPSSTEQDTKTVQCMTLDVPIKEIAFNNLKVTPSRNYNEILTFLDEVDKSCSVILNAAKIRAYSVKKSAEKLLIGSMPSMDSLLQMSRVDLAQKVIGMYLELEEKSSSVQLLQETLNDQRQVTQKMMKNSETESQKKIKTQKAEYETVIKRHQKFIDQLINEKKSLSEQCENLIKKVKEQEERHSSAIKAVEHRCKVEIQATKERLLIAEKMRREKWLLGKTEKIKELTVKGLEPELHNMKVRHDQEISDLRTLHKQEIEELELRASRRTHQQCEALREQLMAERDEILQKERDSLNQKVTKTIENEEKNYQEERRRLVAEHERIKQRLEEQYSSKSRELESRIEIALKEKDRTFESTTAAFEDRIETLKRKHKNEMKTLKENYEIEQESWKSNIKKEQEMWKLTKEKEIVACCKKERDREIELVIDRLENESIELRTQIETTAENRIKRLNEKYTNEIKYLEESEKQAQGRYLEVKNQLMNNENDLIYLRGVIKKMEKKLEDLGEENSQLITERGRVQDIIRQELESEMKSLQTQLINLRSEREREMEEVYERVKSAISKKDETIAKMRQEYMSLEEKCDHLDQLLKTQRKNLLIRS